MQENEVTHSGQKVDKSFRNAAASVKYKVMKYISLVYISIMYGIGKC